MASVEFVSPPVEDVLTQIGNLQAREFTYNHTEGMPPINVAYLRETVGEKVLAFPPYLLTPQSVVTTKDGLQTVATLNLSDALDPKVMMVDHTRDVCLALYMRTEVSANFRFLPTFGGTALPDHDLLSFTIYERDRANPHDIRSCRAGVLYSRQYAGRDGIYSPERALWYDVNESISHSIINGLQSLSQTRIKLRILNVLGNVQITTPVRLINVAPSKLPELEQNTISIVTERMRVRFPSVRVAVDIGSRPCADNFRIGGEIVSLTDFDQAR